MLNSFTLDVFVEDSPDVLARIVMLLHRLAIRIRTLVMKPPKTSGRMRIIIEVESDADVVDRISVSLLKLVHVVSVETRKPAAKSVAKTREVVANNR